MTPREHARRFGHLILLAGRDYARHKSSLHAAALAFYSVFSLAPLLVVALVIVGFVYGDEAASGQVFAELSLLVGSEVASIAEGLVEQASYGGQSYIATIISIATLLYGSSKVFTALQDALNMIWRVPDREVGGIKEVIKTYALSLALVPGFGVLFLIMVVSTTIVSAFGEALLPYTNHPRLWSRLTDTGLSLVFITLMFASIFKLLPNKKLDWHHVLGGAAVTASLFVLGKIFIGFYLGVTTTGSVFGAAGTLAVLLTWFYLSAQIFLFGASLTHAWATQIEEEEEDEQGASEDEEE